MPILLEKQKKPLQERLRIIQDNEELGASLFFLFLV